MRGWDDAYTYKHRHKHTHTHLHVVASDEEVERPAYVAGATRLALEVGHNGGVGPVPTGRHDVAPVAAVVYKVRTCVYLCM